MADLSVAQLMETDLWSEHPVYTREDWQAEVANGDTQLGYWNWVQNRIEMEDELGGNDSLGG